MQVVYLGMLAYALADPMGLLHAIVIFLLEAACRHSLLTNSHK